MFSPSGGEQATFQLRQSPSLPAQVPTSAHQPSSNQTSQSAQYHAGQAQFQNILSHESSYTRGVQYHQQFRYQVTTQKSSYQRQESAHDDLHSPPVRDAASLKGVKYGPGHEKYPSWPSAAAAEVPAATRAPPTGGSHRSKSWTDHTHYPKETLLVYTRPFMKRNAHSHPQQLRPVFEASDKSADAFKSRLDSTDKRFDTDSKDHFAQRDFLPSPPERGPQSSEDFPNYPKPLLQQELKMQYPKTFPGKEHKKLTQAELEEYTRNYEETLNVQHQKQSSYAQSEGYHSYVSSTDSTSTPFLDRLRREVDAGVSRSDSGLSTGGVWEARGDRDSVVTTSSGSASSSETLKWHGSLSDISVASSSFSSTSKQLIVHSAKVKTPQRHGSESVLYIEGPAKKDDIEHREAPSCQQHLKLFPISTYSVPEPDTRGFANRANNSYSPPQMTVAERVSELERQSKYVAYQDTKRSARVGDPVLKAKQKKALLSFYERQQQKESQQSWRSEPQLASEAPQPPPQPKPLPTSRRASSASDYADWRERDMLNPAAEKRFDRSSSDNGNAQQPFLVPNSARFSPNSVLDGPVILGPVICLDDWVPERPPKNSKLLRNAFPDLYSEDDRSASPDLPLPSPPTVFEDEVFNNDEPFPPPPVEITSDWKYSQEIPERLIKETKACKQQNQNTFESLPKPTPIRSMKKPDSVSDQNNQGLTRSHNEMSSRPTDLSLSSNNALPLSQNTYKRAYSNFNDSKLYRSSFRVPHETPVHGVFAHMDIRASMRNYRSCAAVPNKAPQKPTISAQKLLFRSTTVEDSPKRPINPFLRTSSLNQGESEKNKCIPVKDVQNLSNQKMSSGRQQQRYSCGPIMFHNNSNEQQSPVENAEGDNELRSDCDKNVVSNKKDLHCEKVENKAKVFGTKKSSHQKQLALSGPPPLHPKQSSSSKVGAKVTSAEQDSTLNRGEDSVCYAPSRASLPEPAAGSYKRIQHKDELPAPVLHPRPALPDLLPNTARRPYTHYDTPPHEPTFDPSMRDKNDKPPTPQQEYTKPKTPEKFEPVLAPENNVLQNGNKVCDKTPEAPQKSPEVNNVCERKIEEQIVKCEEDSHTETTEHADLSPESGEEEQDIAVLEVKNVVEEHKMEKCWEPLPAEVAWLQARQLLMEALPAGHHLLTHTSLSEEVKSPTDYIRHYYGVDSSVGRFDELARAPEKDRSSAACGVTSLEHLKSEVLNCCERLVGELEATSEVTVVAIASNESLGAAVCARLSPPLTTKFVSHHTEIGHVAALMAALSARLARAHHDLAARLDDKQLEMLRVKHDKLIAQLEEAGVLKVDIDARAATVADTLAGALDERALNDYRAFIANKPRLAIRSRHLQHRLEQEKQRLRDLQACLSDR